MASFVPFADLPPLTPASRLADAVYVALRQAILDLRLKPGTPLNVPELARRFNVSRSPVREAVQQLRSEGLAEERPWKGSVVVSLGFEDAMDVHDMRGALEGLAARRAALRADPADVAAMRAVLDEQALAVEALDAQAYAATNQEFHRAISRISSTHHLARTLSHLYGLAQVAIQRAAFTPGHIEKGYAEHVAILDAVRRRDADGAEAQMRAHFARTRPVMETSELR
ncbi:MAG TPA: GntR family transcriptional regulator [Burkholderiales bacterium]|nr:GntR family transcriptional regulator [Burkholderiales bacterium]